MASQIQIIPPRGGCQSQNLWQKALDTLDDNLKASLDFKKSTQRNIVAAVLKTAQEKKRLCLQKRWKYKKANGEEIILRDVVEKIIVWLDKFKAVGDAATQYDSAHASLAWAGVRFLLQVAVGDKHVFGATIDGLEIISHLITRYAIFEDLYMQRDSAVRGELEVMLTGLYAEALIFLAKARKYFQTSTAIRVVKSAFQAAEDDQMQKILAQEAKVSNLAKLADAEIQRDTDKSIAAVRHILEALDDPIKRLVDQATVSAKTLEKHKYLELLHWLSSVPFSRHHEWHSESRVPGSGKWLLDHPQYLSWKRSSKSSILLLHGTLGSGKTSLVSVVVDSFFSESSGQGASLAPLAYFYCAKNTFELERIDPDEIMRSIVRQLAFSGDGQRNVHEALLVEYERREAEAKIDGFEVPRLRIAECVKLIMDMTSSNPAIIVIDAVDEVQESRRHELLDALIRITKESASIVKIFITSRDNNNVFALLSVVPRIRIQNHNNRVDMELFVRHHIALTVQSRRLLDGNISDALQEDMVKTLLDGAGEMFQWVILQIDNLCRMKLEIDIRTKMRRLSEDTLDQLYADTFDRITGGESFARSTAMQAFSWLLSMQEALTPAAFLAAISTTDTDHHIELDLSNLIDICFNMIVLDSKLNVLRFAHVSIQEFLEAKADFGPQRTHRLAAMSCLNVCMQGPPSSMKAELRPAENFYHYGTLYWAKHCKYALVVDRNDALFRRMKDFVFDEDETSLPFISWLDETQQLSEALANDHPLKKALSSVMNSSYSPLFTACVFGLTSLIHDISRQRDIDWNMKNDIGHTGLYLASAAGYEAVARILIQHGANVNATGGRHHTPLHAACFAGHAAVVRLLLEHGAVPKSRGLFDNALQAAFLGDHEKVALILLEDGFDISNQNDYDSILQRAAQAGFTGVVRLLQKTYTSLSEKSGSVQCKAVEAAIIKGRLGVLERFLQKSSDPKHVLPSDAISTAALGGQNSVITLLLDKGLDIEYEGRFGTPLRAASLMGHESTVRVLLGQGAKVNVCGSLGDALHASAMKGHVSITRLLIEEGADVNSRGGFYGNALQAAAYRGHETVVKVLLDAGADVHRKGISRDALHAAAEGGHEVIVRCILESGFNFQHTPPGPQFCMLPRSRYKDLLRGSSPSRVKVNRAPHIEPTKLPDWSERASASTFSILSAVRGIEVPKGHEDFQPYQREVLGFHDEENYPLQAAASKGHESVVRLLLCQWDTLGVSDTEVGHALKEASTNGHKNIVKLLTTSKVDVMPYVKEALERSALHGHLAIVDMLLAYEADSEPDKNLKSLARQSSVSVDSGWRLSSYKACAKYRAYLLMSGQASSQSQIESLRNILLAGCRGGYVPIVTRALELIDQRYPAGDILELRTAALIEAAKSDNGNVIKLLLDGGTLMEADGLFQAFNVACVSGCKSALLSLIENDTRNFLRLQDYDSGLKTAGMKGHHELVRFFVQRSFRSHCLPVLGETIVIASGNGFTDIVRLLVGEVKNSESYTNTLNRALNLASRRGHKEVADFLIREGAEVNAIVEEDLSDEDIITRRGYDNWLCSRGRKNLARSNALQAALQGFQRFSSQPPYAAPKLHGESQQKASAVTQEATIHLLLEKGADVNALAGHPTYPLHTAAAHCSEKVVQSIIDRGADVNAFTTENRTALQAAAGRELAAAAITRKLFQAGAILPVNKIGKNPILNQALAFFGGSITRSRYEGNGGRFKLLGSSKEVLEDGPGAVVKILLTYLPEEKADDERYGLLLQMAAVAEDRDCVKLLLQRCVDVNAVGYYYGSALQAAARMGNIDIVQILLDAGADVNLLQGAHGTALRAAVMGGHANVASILIKYGADVNLRFQEKDYYNKSSESILHLAVRTGSLAIVQLLLTAGAELYIDILDEQHVLTAACDAGDVAIVQQLLASGAAVNASGKKRRSYRDIVAEYASPLHMASARGHESVARALLDHGAEREKEVETSGTPLQAAARAGHLPIVRLLIEAGVNVDNSSCGETALSIASSKGHLEVVQELLVVGASIADHPHIPNALAAACQGRYHSIIELLLEELSGTVQEKVIGADALSAACTSGDDETVQLLLYHGAPSSPAIFRQACAAGLEGTVRTLLESGLDMNSDDADGGHVLHVAACHLQSAIVRLLIDRGADVRFQSEKYGSPLLAVLEGCMAPKLRRWAQSRSEHARSLATALPLPAPRWPDYLEHRTSRTSGLGYKNSTECERIVQALVNSGADVNTELRGFGNALHLASYMGSEVIVSLLLDKGSDVNSSGGYFETALLAALEGKHLAIVKLLLRSGINVNHSSLEHGTALHHACLYRDEATVRILLSYGADVNASGGKYGSPLAAAASRENKFNRYQRRTDGHKENNAIVDLLLQYGDRIKIRESDLLAAAANSNSLSRELYLKLFLEHDKNVQATEAIIVAAAGNLSGPPEVEVLQLLLERDGGLGITEAMLKAAANPEVMKKILQHSPICRITPEILEAAATKSFYGIEVIQLLIAHDQHIHITEGVVVAALKAAKSYNTRTSGSTGSLLQLLLDRTGELGVTEAMLKAASRPLDMKTLLKHGPRVSVTQDVLEAVASRYRDGEALVRLLLEHDRAIKITPALVLQVSKKAREAPSFMSALLEHDPDLSITAEVLLAIVESYRSDEATQRLVELLLRYGKKLIFTEEIRMTIDHKFRSHGRKDLKSLFYQLEDKNA